MSEDERLNQENMQSDDESEELSDNDSEYVTVDITEHPLYNVLSSIFEDTEGNNIVEKMNDLNIIKLYDAFDTKKQVINHQFIFIGFFGYGVCQWCFSSWTFESTYQ